MMSLREANCRSRDRNTGYLAYRAKPSKTAANRLIRRLRPSRLRLVALRPDKSGVRLILTALTSARHRSRRE
jgi:hypothetical protein